MLSKEEKLKYGEILRQQMKEKQQRKKMDDLAKRQNYNIPKSQSDRVLAADRGVFDPKIILQQKLETQDYNPFGKAGGGAPNKKLQPGEHNLSGVMSSSPQDVYSPKTHPNQPQPQYYPEQYPQQIDPRYNMSQGTVPMRNDMNVNPQLHPHAYQQPQQFQKSGNEYPGRPSYPQKQSYSPQLAKKTVDPRMIPQQKYYQPAEQILNPFAPPQRNPQQEYNQKQFQDYPPRTYQNAPEQPAFNDMYRPEYPPNHSLQVPGVRVKTNENEQLQEMYKRGGRNLLKLENQTTNEHLVKQKQKQEMKNFLKQQMEQAERKKQEEKQKIKREELEQERRNREYIQMQNQKLRDQQRKKVEEKQKIVDENLRNLAKRKELEQEAKDKLQRERLEQERRMNNEQQRRINNEQQRRRERQKPKDQYIQIRQQRPSRDQTPSSLSSAISEASITKNNFNTQISREFVRKQKMKQKQRNQHDKKLDLFTNQIQKMRDEISNQGEMFKKEMDKIKKEAENAQDQKRRAQLQIQKLKLELEKKSKEKDLRLLEALKRNDPYSQQQIQHPVPYQQLPPPPPPKQQYRQYQEEYDSLNQLSDLDDRAPYGIPTKPPSYSAKPMAKTNKVYQQPPVYEQKQSQSRQKFKWQQDFKLQQSVIGTLQGDSKKIPLSLQKNTKLTMSNIQNYGKESFMYGKPQPLPPPPQQSRQASRQQKRHQRRNDIDQLDRLVDHNPNKWQMSTVKDDITHQIEQLLRKKDGPGRSVPSQMQSGVRPGLSRGAIPYQGPGLNTLNSNKVSLVSNGGTMTVDVDKIHDRNEARLRELRALGVQTINTTNDQDLNRLNALLNNYH